MIQFVEPVLEAFLARLAQMSANRCLACGGQDAVVVDRRPYAIQMFTADFKNPNQVECFRVVCRLCGFTMLYDLQQFHTGDDPIFETVS